MTSEEARTCWPPVAAAVDRYLASRGVRRELRQDLVQDTAVKALTAPGPVLNLEAWSVRTAHNAWVSVVRREAGRNLPMDSVPEQRARPDDVADDYMRRERAKRALRAVAALPDAERLMLVAAMNGTATPLPRKEAVTRNVRVHRLRKRLLAQLGALAGALGINSWRSGTRTVPLTAAAAVAPLMLGAVLLLPPLPHPPAPPAAPHRHTPHPEPAEATPDARAVIAEPWADGGAAGEAPSRRRPPTPRGASGPAAVPDSVTVGAPTVVVSGEDRPGRVLACAGGLPLIGEVCLEEPRSARSAGDTSTARSLELG